MFFDMDPTILSGLVGAGQNAVSSLLGMADGAINRKFQRKEAEKNRNWQSEEAALQRDWSAAEAERARDWNEEMYEKYNSLSGKIAQAEQAGVNPMLAVTGSAVTPMSASASAPGGASAGSVGTPSGMSSSARGLIDIMANITGLKRQQSEADVNEALAAKYNAEEENIRKNTSWIDRLNNMSLEESKQQIAKSVSDILVNEQDIAESNKRIESLAANILATNKDLEVKSAQIAVLIEQVATEQAKRVQMSHQNDLTDKQREEISKNIEFLGAKITEVSQQNDFFDKVKGYRENLEKARSDNASTKEKLSALAPILGKIDFPYEFDDNAFAGEKTNLYQNNFKKYLDTYIDIMIEVANSK